MQSDLAVIIKIFRMDQHILIDWIKRLTNMYVLKGIDIFRVQLDFCIYSSKE